MKFYNFFTYPALIMLAHSIPLVGAEALSRNQTTSISAAQLYERNFTPYEISSAKKLKQKLHQDLGKILLIRYRDEKNEDSLLEGGLIKINGNKIMLVTSTPGEVRTLDLQKIHLTLYLAQDRIFNDTLSFDAFLLRLKKYDLAICEHSLKQLQFQESNFQASR